MLLRVYIGCVFGSVLLILGGCGASGTERASELPAPQGVKAESRCDGVLVAWEAVEGANRYALYRADSSTFPGEDGLLHDDLMHTNRLDQSASSAKGTEFSYWVAGVDAEGARGERSERVEGIVEPKPATPNLSEDSAGFPEGFIVRWRPVEWADRYEVSWNWRSSPTGREAIPGSGCQQKIMGDCQYLDNRSLKGNQAETRYYWVRAIGACGTSEYQTTPLAVTRPRP